VITAVLEKAVNSKYYECVFECSVIQHGMRMRRIIILKSVTCPALLQFSTLFHKRNDLKNVLNKKVFKFSLKFLFEIFLILQKNKSARYHKRTVRRASCKVLIIF
jgi:hypothetical protein